MPTWIWVLLLALAAVALAVLVWWSSGRSPLRARGSGSQLSPQQRQEIDRHRLDTAMRPNNSNPNNLGGR